MHTQQKICLTSNERSYIAGFLDGDGSILAQIVRRKDYRLKFQIRVSVTFYQKTDKHWFMLWLKKKLRYGSIRKKPNGMSDYVIVGNAQVAEVLLLLCNRLHLKKPLAKHVLKIVSALNELKHAENTTVERERFLDICEMVDHTATLTYSKTRQVTTATVRKEFASFPVETNVQ